MYHKLRLDVTILSKYLCTTKGLIDLNILPRQDKLGEKLHNRDSEQNRSMKFRI